MRTYVLIACFALLIIFGAFARYPKQTATSKNAVVYSVSLLKQQKKALDKRNISYKTKGVSVWVKLYDKGQLLRIKNDKWPDEQKIEYTYNVIKNDRGNVVMIMAYPTSQSGDWDIAYSHYFNQEGKLIAFERFTGFFNSGCAGDGGVARETVCNYYNGNFKVIGKTYSLTDGDGKKLVKSKCDFLYDFKDYKIYPDVAKCLAGYHINAALL